MFGAIFFFFNGFGGGIAPPDPPPPLVIGSAGGGGGFQEYVHPNYGRTRKRLINEDEEILLILALLEKENLL